MTALKHMFVLAALAATLSGCGGSDGNSSSGMASAPGSVPRGALLASPPAKVATLGPSDLLALLGGSALGKTFLQLAYTPACTITIYHLTYQPPIRTACSRRPPAP